MKFSTKYVWLLVLLYSSTFNAQQQAKVINLPIPPQSNITIQTGDYIAQDQINIKPQGPGEVHLTPQIIGTDQVHLFIDPSIVLAIPYSSNTSSGGSPPNTNITRTLDFNLPVGTTSAAYNVSTLGSLGYNIPITTAPGTKGIEPTISIDYNSLNTNGIVGYGWNINGVESISRLGQTIYHNGGSVNGISLTNEDWFSSG